MGSTFSLATASLSAGVSIAGAQQQAQAQKQANELSALQYDQQAVIYDVLAGVQEDFGIRDYESTRTEYESIAGQQSAYYGASGVSVNSGSAQSVVTNTLAEGVYAAEMAQYNRDLAAWELRNNAAQSRFSATILRNTSVSPLLAGLTSGVGSLGNISSQYSQWNKS